MTDDDLYIIRQKGTDYYKIGRSYDPKLRLNNMKTANPLGLELCLIKRGYGDYEKNIHKIYEDYCVNNEWFEFKKDEIDTIIYNIKQLEFYERKKKTSKLNNNVRRTKNTHIAFTPQEKDDLAKYAKEMNCTKSEFIRQAIFDKIMRIENPKLFENKTINHSNEYLKKELQIIKNKFETLNLIEEKLEKIEKIILTHDKIDDIKQLERIIYLQQVIEQMIYHLGSLTIKQIKELTNNIYSYKIIKKCVENSDKLKINDKKIIIIKKRG